MKLLVYSHDAFGLGNIRRMLAICQYLLKAFSGVSILVVSGSPALHSLRLPSGLDYIKLPCLGRDSDGEMGVKYLGTKIEDAVQLRSDLILTAVKRFQPDLILVDKKPDGLESELRSTLKYLKLNCPNTKLVLLLRDILDRPDVTIAQWQQKGYYKILEALYDQIWVVGTPDIFDVRKAYQFSTALSQKVRFCGYIQRETGQRSRTTVRRALRVQPFEKLVVVTPGGGADGYQLVQTYLDSLALMPTNMAIKSLIITGPEMADEQRYGIQQQVAANPQVGFLEFTDDLVSYLKAADLVVSMAGYNTIGEILTLRKRAIVVPRLKPVEEQWIRAERMAELGLFQAIHPDQLTPQKLQQSVWRELQAKSDQIPPTAQIDMQALPRIAHYLSLLVNPHPRAVRTRLPQPPTWYAQITQPMPT
ncbi:MAG: glycosyltransferase [Elainella sp. Prado103]|jgi:predicted glycosyltransferase|nr:glycosyltransferase [Elainella sp. Prado103]